jgi:hypothetical protein
MSKILRLHSGGNEQLRGWQESHRLEGSVIDQITDPAGGNAKRPAPTRCTTGW